MRPWREMQEARRELKPPDSGGVANAVKEDMCLIGVGIYMWWLRVVVDYVFCTCVAMPHVLAPPLPDPCADVQ